MKTLLLILIAFCVIALVVGIVGYHLALRNMMRVYGQRLKRMVWYSYTGELTLPPSINAFWQNRGWRPNPRYILGSGNEPDMLLEIHGERVLTLLPGAAQTPFANTLAV